MTARSHALRDFTAARPDLEYPDCGPQARRNERHGFVRGYVVDSHRDCASGISHNRTTDDPIIDRPVGVRISVLTMFGSPRHGRTLELAIHRICRAWTSTEGYAGPSLFFAAQILPEAPAVTLPILPTAANGMSAE